MRVPLDTELIQAIQPGSLGTIGDEQQGVTCYNQVSHSIVHLGPEPLLLDALHRGTLCLCEGLIKLTALVTTGFRLSLIDDLIIQGVAEKRGARRQQRQQQLGCEVVDALTSHGLVRRVCLLAVST